MESILIIDDEAQIRSMIRLILEREGYVVMEAPDGTEGIRQFREKPTDLIITDIIMPNKDGIRTIWELKQLRPELRIIAMSGGVPGGPRSDLPLATAYGAARTLQKPFTRAELLGAVAAVIG